MPTTLERRLISLLIRSNGFVEEILRQCAFRERRVGGHIAFGGGEDLGGFREPFLEHADNGVELGAGGLGVGLGVDCSHGRSHHVLVGVVDRGQHVVRDVGFAALPGGAGEHPGD